MFTRLGLWCHDRRKLVLVTWILVLVVGNAVAGAVGDSYRQDLNLPDVESRDGIDLLNDQFEGQGAGFTGTIVFQADQGVDDPEVEAAMSELFDTVAAEDGVSRVVSPYDRGGEQQVSQDGTIAYASVEFPGGDDADFEEIHDCLLYTSDAADE